MYPQAEDMYLRSLKSRELLLSNDHPHIISTKHNLGELYAELGEKEKSEEYFLQAMEAMRRMDEREGKVT